MILLLNVWDKILSLNHTMKLDLLCVICMRAVVSFSSIRLLCLFGLGANGEAQEMRTALFWVITQWPVVISYWRFGATHRSHPQGSRIQIFWGCFWILEPWGWDRWVVPKRRNEITVTCRVMTQKNEVNRLLRGGSLKSRINTTTGLGFRFDTLQHKASLYTKL